MTCNGKLTGVVSFSIGCTNASFPGVYTKIQHYTEWIKSNIEPDTTTTTEKQLINGQGSSVEPDPTVEQGSTIKQGSATEKQTTTPSTGTDSIVNIGAIIIPLILFIISK